jgi:hypothetical protein
MNYDAMIPITDAYRRQDRTGLHAQSRFLGHATDQSNRGTCIYHPGIQHGKSVLIHDVVALLCFA